MAVGTLTAVPVRGPSTIDRSTARAAMVLAPFASALIAVPAGIVAYLGGLAHLPSLLVAFLVVGTVALGSRGLHLDGLADTADGLSASYDRERALEIMRRGDTGPMGAATVVIVLGIQVSSLAAVLLLPWAPVLVGVVICVSRMALWFTCAVGVPAARPGGLGAVVAGVVPKAVAAFGFVVAVGLICATMIPTGRPWWQGALAVVIASLAVAALTGRCVKRFGGITGDVLGASIETALASLLVVAAAGF
ncbi:adenosylcobinamide-GDP ribazoletransferase [Nakamurella antarctica]|uniref:Adenosylcobinamide-GDP ribazoletransferase n=2 Tax=Nakamurella antarctica TaxID=1902245 RepID=A0A3G8ZQW2_9ACTN|nr:adenosylcobinamide-GDP ribazoletransferase [Nakamurella antarctica]